MFHHDVDDQRPSCSFGKTPREFAAFDEIEIGVDFFLQSTEMLVDVVPRQVIRNGQHAFAGMGDCHEVDNTILLNRHGQYLQCGSRFAIPPPGMT